MSDKGFPPPWPVSLSYGQPDAEGPTRLWGRSESFWIDGWLRTPKRRRGLAFDHAPGVAKSGISRLSARPARLDIRRVVEARAHHGRHEGRGHRVRLWSCARCHAAVRRWESSFRI